jgi:hypothetical protein
MKSKKTITKMQILWTIVLIIIELISNINAAHRSSHPFIRNNKDLIESILIPYNAYPGSEVNKFNSKLIKYNKNDINKEIPS